MTRHEKFEPGPVTVNCRLSDTPRPSNTEGTGLRPRGAQWEAPSGLVKYEATCRNSPQIETHPPFYYQFTPSKNHVFPCWKLIELDFTSASVSENRRKPLPGVTNVSSPCPQSRVLPISSSTLGSSHLPSRALHYFR
ncbi:hypothetical protein RRG08_038291 [Elysia crispata]|uniref:Uncharacterized protein n=1 Tax=Elysia crispata TaxID=231223 RepID=A0AAE1E252_9GAST|nr:hypothetical protein RRG08_038291 [Elysia crispata]